ncbi:AMP-binding protein [Umezawaea endophytica]|uniref:AMP-binding protein n=1 Tax=Umezawaea endophytica TaxID=1654476 RepID=A0A9X3AJ76_9PSEU|nr:AMP-binding protein [Umezawaea endophytica]MCS7484172.1 AMP-binding protein [Umezawaea endophytica]
MRASAGRGQVPVVVSAATTEGLAALTRAAGVTTSVLLRAAVAVLLARLGAGEEIPLGVTVAGRSGEENGTAVLRADVSGDPSFRELLARVRDVDTGAPVPTERLAEVLGLALVQVLLDDSGAGLPAPDVFDLVLRLREDGGSGVVEYAADLFDPATAERFAGRFTAVLDQVAISPDAPIGTLDVLLPGERRTLTADTAADIPDWCVHELVEEQARRVPDAVALISGDERITYAALNARANRLAHRLIDDGVRRGELVGVRVDRGPDFVVTLLALLKAGAGYLALEPSQPIERVRVLLEEAGVHRVVGVMPDVSTYSGYDPALDVDPRGTACVLGTSGVISSHLSVVSAFFGRSYVHFGPDEVFLQCSPVSSDAAVLELFGALLHGGTCVLAPCGGPDPATVERHGVTTLSLPAERLFDDPSVLGLVRQVVIDGGADAVDDIRKVRAAFPDLRLVHGYAPAGCLSFATAHQITADDATAVPLGTPLANTDVLVLDAALRLVPTGVVGEVYVGGLGLAEGYAGRMRQTAERFVASPFRTGARLYRTGDLARWNGRGELELVGRTDDPPSPDRLP